MKNANVAQIELMWHTHRYEVDCAILAFFVSYVTKKVTKDQIEDNLKYKESNWKKLKIMNQIEKVNIDKGTNGLFRQFEKQTLKGIFLMASD